MLIAFASPRNLDKRRLQLAKTTGVVQAAGDGVVQAAGNGVVQAAHRRSWCFCVCGVWLALALVRIRREIERERYILRPPKFVRMRVRVRTRVHVTGGVLARGLTCVGRLSEQPHWRWSKQGAAVAKQGGLGELSGLCRVYRPKRRPAEGAVLFRPIVWLYSASVVLGSTLHLALVIFQQGIPCFGHRPIANCKSGC